MNDVVMPLSAATTADAIDAFALSDPTEPLASLPARPTLPEPTRLRWQPLRLGLVELFHYDSEEFWFRDGHLLLRGNNGTGKSKVLSLTLPFLFDAQLKSSRIEPDGDAGKKMAWNLLLGRHERRMGYAWIEFGRLGDDGTPQYLSLGCGLSAAAAKPQVDSWFFVLDGERIGRDLWLTSPQRVVLTRERLREHLREHFGDSLQGAGQVFDTATAYRRAVDERLFHLGPARYGALMDTLIQLRQPQLSKKPDEGSLSDALTEALPPLSPDLLTDVAEALNQLEENRRELEEYEALARAIGQFSRRYLVYAATQARRQAATLRAAQSGFDTASRVLNEARRDFHQAQDAEAQARSRHTEAELSLAALRASLDLLQSDPAMQDANRLALAEKDASDRARDRVAADAALAATRTRLQRETDQTRERADRAAQTVRTLAEARALTTGWVDTLGVTALYRINPLAAADTVALCNLDPLALDTARNDLRQLAATRREQLALIQRRRNEVDAADAWRAQTQRACDERRDESQEASARRDSADETVEQQGRALLGAWQAHVDGLQQLRWPDTAAALDALAQWIASLQGDNPARAALHAAQQQASERLAQQHAALSNERAALQAETDSLQAERARLEQGVDTAPPAPSHRAPDVRLGRGGAPLWQLVDFQPQVDTAQRAGLEAALEAAGLLDAWVTPDGTLQLGDEAHPLHDTQWLRRVTQTTSLATWLRPSEALADSGAVPAAIVQRLIEGVVCSMVDDGSAETWIAPDGRFRVGTLAGAWRKPLAAYIGYAARAAARERRLAEITRRLGELRLDDAALQTRFDELALQRSRAAFEWQSAPGDEALRKSHVEAAAREREFQSASARLDQAEQQLRDAEQTLQAARHALANDAQDLALPDTRAGLQAVEQALTQFGESLHHLFQSVHELQQTSAELARQREREAQAGADAAQRAEESGERRLQAEEAHARYETLREAVGAMVEEMQRRLKEARSAVITGERLQKAEAEAQRLAGETRARSEQKAQDAEATLDERSATRQSAVVRLQGFAATGLLATALPNADVPDLRQPWTIEPALTLARRAEQALQSFKDDDESWRHVQAQVSVDYSELGRALSALGHQAQADTNDFGLVVHIVYQNQPQPPDRLTLRLDAEIAERRALLTAGERKVLENHLQAEIAFAVQKLLRDAELQVEAINKELHKRPTSTGVRFRLQWQPLPEGGEGAPVGLEAARKRLLHTSTDLWSAEDRQVVGAMLQQRIAEERLRADAGRGPNGGGSLLDQLANALDYRRWHRFRVQRWQDGAWRPLSGPASSGERALGLTVPLFAAVASYYSQGASPHAPRLVLLDEAFAGIDDAARAHCMGLIREFDLDFVITSEREWACYAELPGVAICQLQRREGIDAVYVSRWTWDGRARLRQDDPGRRFGPVPIGP